MFVLIRLNFCSFTEEMFGDFFFFLSTGKHKERPCNNSPQEIMCHGMLISTEKRPGNNHQDN